MRHCLDGNVLNANFGKLDKNEALIGVIIIITMNAGMDRMEQN